MTKYSKEAKATVEEVLNKFDRHTSRIEKIKERIQSLKNDLSKLNQDKDFDKYHKKNKEVNYYEKELVKAIDEYEKQRFHNRMEIENKLLSPITKGMQATRNSVNYEKRKDEIIQDFTHKMNTLGKEHNEAVTEYVADILPELEEVKNHFGDTDFKHLNLMQVTTAHYYFKSPLKEYLEENGGNWINGRLQTGI